MSYRLGVDVGGTFTDLLLIKRRHRRNSHGVALHPEDSPSACSTASPAFATNPASTRKSIHRVMHGTTVATNAVLTGKGRAGRAGHHQWV